MSHIVIRPGVQAERSSLEALQWRASLANSGDRDSLLAHPDAISLPPEQLANGHVFVAEQDDVVVGFAAIVARPDGDTELDGLFVEPSLWKQGVGRLLVQHCADVARAGASRILHVVGNPHAEGFYAACGFRTTGAVETRFGAGFEMERQL
jgi:GNAT superfamily N-acetyltransferase